MNKYKVERVRERLGVEIVTLSREVSAVSDKQAISQTRYELTRSEAHPNGEPTEYTDEQGNRIFWRAELIATEKVLELEEVPTLDSITKYNEPWLKLQTKLKAPKNSVSKFGGCNYPETVHIIAKGKTAERFFEIKAQLGCKTNTDALAEIIKCYNPTTDGGVFVLPDAPAKSAKAYATLLNVPVENIYYKAVKYYLTKLGNMTLNDLLKNKEADNGTA